MRSHVTVTIPVNMEEPAVELCWTINVPVMWVIQEATVKVSTSNLWMFNFIIRTLIFTLLKNIEINWEHSVCHMYVKAFLIFKILSTSDEIPCDRDNPCQHGGTCSGTMLIYQCSCDVGYTGTNCESKYQSTYGFNYHQLVAIACHLMFRIPTINCR